MWSDGSYELNPEAPSRAWLKGVAPKLRVGSAWAALTLGAVSGPSTGTDAIGAYQKAEFVWHARGNGSITSTLVTWATSIRAYASPATTVFAQNFTSGLQTDGRLGKDQPLSMWPAFATASPAPPLRYLSFTGCMSGTARTGAFTANATAQSIDPAPGSNTTAQSIDQHQGRAAPGSNVNVSQCSQSVASQHWTLLDGEMLRNAFNGQCLQVGHCRHDTGAEIAVNQKCRLASMCDGRNLQWSYFANNASLVSQLSGSCLTLDTKGMVYQSPCLPGSPDQNFLYRKSTSQFVSARATGQGGALCLNVMTGVAPPGPHPSPAPPAPPSPPSPPNPPNPNEAPWSGQQGKANFSCCPCAPVLPLSQRKNPY